MRVACACCRGAPSAFDRNIEIEIHEEHSQAPHSIIDAADCGKRAPISISDAEIYRYLPTVLVGTVDRLLGRVKRRISLIFSVRSIRVARARVRVVPENASRAAANRTKSKFLPVDPSRIRRPLCCCKTSCTCLRNPLARTIRITRVSRRTSADGGHGIAVEAIGGNGDIEGYIRHVERSTPAMLVASRRKASISTIRHMPARMR